MLQEFIQLQHLAIVLLFSQIEALKYGIFTSYINEWINTLATLQIKKSEL